MASRRLADALSKACRIESGHARQGAGVFVAPLKIMLDQLKNSLQAQPVTLKTLPADLVECAGRPRTA